MRIVVVGASAAGLRAASRSKRLLPKANVIVIDRGRFISYGACGMPYFVSGDIGSADKLRETAYGVIRDPAFFRKAKGLEVVTQTEVERIERQERKVISPGRPLMEKPKNTLTISLSWPPEPAQFFSRRLPKIAAESPLFGCWKIPLP